MLAALLLGPAPEPPPERYAQLSIRQRLVVRVPAFISQPRPAKRTPGQIVEKKGPKCLPLDKIAGASITERSSIDVIVRGGDSYRARFAASCPELDYYGGFYILPTKDGKVCAGRDAVHTRSGGECEIERFRRLVPAK